MKDSGELESVRYLLRKWRRWKRNWFPDLGAPHAVPFIDGMKGDRPMDGWDDPEEDDARIYAWTMLHVDQAVEALPQAHRIAIHIEYMKELGPAVWRSNKVPREQIKRLCTEAELALILALRRRDVPL